MNFFAVFLMFATCYIGLVHGYDRYDCLQCVKDGSKVYTQEGCQTSCPQDSEFCIKSRNNCVSNCEQCAQQQGKKFSPAGCTIQCPQDTWCYLTQYQSKCPKFVEITVCAQCLTFGGYFLEGEGCVSSCNADLTECISPREKCRLENVFTCEECVQRGGLYAGPPNYCIGASNPFIQSTQIC